LLEVVVIPVLGVFVCVADGVVPHVAKIGRLS
jgi:hypothetical protein